MSHILILLSFTVKKEKTESKVLYLLKSPVVATVVAIQRSPTPRKAPSKPPQYRNDHSSRNLGIEELCTLGYQSRISCLLPVSSSPMVVIRFGTRLKVKGLNHCSLTYEHKPENGGYTYSRNQNQRSTS